MAIKSCPHIAWFNRVMKSSFLLGDAREERPSQSFITSLTHRKLILVTAVIYNYITETHLGSRAMQVVRRQTK